MRFLLAICLLTSISSFAQEAWHKVPDRARDSVYYRLPINQYWYNQPWKDSVYRFGEFQLGRFEFSTGFSPPTRLNMNYNVFLETMDTKDSLGVVRRMGKFPEIKFIWIGDRKFYNHPSFGYLELIIDGTISIGVKSFMALGIESRDGSGRVYSPAGVDYRTSAEGETRLYYPGEIWYIVDLDDKVHRIGSLLLPQLLPKMKYKIKAFEKANKIDYRNRTDILKFVKFCNDNYVAPEKALVERHTLRVPLNTSLENSEWRDSIYRFAQFEDALIRYKEGKADASRRLNFDFQAGWFKTVNNRNDTLLFWPPGTLVTVNMDGVIFMNDVVEGPLEILKQGFVGLAEKKRIVTNDEFNVKPLGESYSVSRQQVYEIERSYYFIKKSRAFPATPRMLTTLFPMHKQKINEHLVNNNVNFDSREDIAALLAYCERL